MLSSAWLLVAILSVATVPRTVAGNDRIRYNEPGCTGLSECTTAILSEKANVILFSDGEGEYSNNLKLCWEVKAADGVRGRVKCEVTQADLEEDYDTLALFNGEKGLESAKLRATDVWYVCPGSSMFFELCTDYSVGDQGFEVKCGLERSGEDDLECKVAVFAG
eukprot:CAMPEP_0119119336 /NCGR_PEP_ID=MMETSP1310-20130426/867_1 /TAXON_ID=464262 /ORGANISM="Genus nov. species nov., Strain RCC2339" /LENGTH=163 /DNA_ID=CAMNT_0007108763 /DNA_START=77 /DNA_END=568 /DNA_ORIENTATION=+